MFQIRAETSDLQGLFNKACTDKSIQTLFSITFSSWTTYKRIFLFGIPDMWLLKKKKKKVLWTHGGFHFAQKVIIQLLRLIPRSRLAGCNQNRHWAQKWEEKVLLSSSSINIISVSDG